MQRDLLLPLRKFHGRMHAWREYVYPILKKKKRNPNIAFLIMTPEHDNLGDQALAWTEEKMLRHMDVDFVEITGMTLILLAEYGWLGIMNGHTIFFNGGGYLGTLWPSSEQMVRRVLKKNPRSTVCILPNTVYYSDSPEGRLQRQQSVQLYGKHKKLYLYAREKTSYEEMLRLYKNVKLVPDVVLSLNLSAEQIERNGCLLCLREDLEKTRTPEIEAEIVHQARMLFGENVISSDMYAGHRILPDAREEELNKKFAQFKGAQLVITDRLHGMIFCAITGTPCIVIDSKSHKIRGCFDWIRNLEYICFAEDPTEIARIYSQMRKTNCEYDNKHLQPYFEELYADIRRYAGQ